MKSNGYLLTGLALVSGVLTSSKNKEVKAPNVIIIMADDMGYSDIGCYGGEIRTPNLDALAGNGIRFTQFYNNARSCPTRAALLTGLYPHQAGIGYMVSENRGKGYEGNINDQCVTIAEVLRTANYSTYMTGKWHLSWSIKPSDKSSWPIQRGFDMFYGTIDGAGSLFEPHTLTYNNEPINETPQSFYYTDAISDSSVSFIEDHFKTKGNKPFFMYVAYTSPHWPLHAPEEEIMKYEGVYNAGWDILRSARYNRMKEMGIIDPGWRLSERDPAVKPWDQVGQKDHEARKMMVYAAMVSKMDQGIGRIIKKLRENKALDNTVIFFLSDNGGCAETFMTDTEWIRNYGPEVNKEGKKVVFGNNSGMEPGPADTYQSYGVGWANLSNTPFRYYKHAAYEGGISTPLIVHWPGRIKDKGGLRHEVTGIIDMMSTCVSISGAKYPSVFNGSAIHPTEGKDITSLFQKDAELQRDGYFVEHGGSTCIRNGDWKLVKRGAKAEWCLYNMKDDRTETVDLAGKYPEIVAQLTDKWENWAWRVYVLPKK